VAPPSDPTTAAAPPPADELSYFDRLQTSTPPPERLKSPEQLRAAQTKAPEPVRAPEAAKAPEPVKTPVKPAVAAQIQKPQAPVEQRAAGEPQGAGFAVQIAALNVRSEADAIAKRLASKGYAAYVMMPASGAPPIYRVRIGKFGSRLEAETIKTKLEKEEQFKPWITR
jgi:cell division septation protein DedD